MSDLVRNLCKNYPCRESQIQQLCNLYGHNDEAFVECVYLFGCASTGKSAILSSVLEAANINIVLVNLIECYTSKILFELVINSLMNDLVKDKDSLSLAKCDNMIDFISSLQHLHKNYLGQTVIVLDKAERLRDMDANLLPAFLRFKELSQLPISVVLVSELEFTKLIPRSSASPPVEIFFPQYTKDELCTIISKDLDASLPQRGFKLKDSHTFFTNYLQVFLSVFCRVCRDLSELRYLAKKNLSSYYKPIEDGRINENDVVSLWRNIAPTLKSSLNTVYLRVNNEVDSSLTRENEAKEVVLPKGINPLQNSKSIAQALELPFYAKYLLIAAYLASYNPVKEDKRLFLKYHGKQTKTKSQINAKNKVSERMNTQLGPKPFTFDRLLAIFYSIIEEEVSLNSNFLIQISSLVQLQLLSAIGDNSSLDNHKYKCNVSLEFIQTISKMVGFNITRYLYDFI